MASTDSLTLTIKGPDTKFSVTLPTASTVLELKTLISTTPASNGGEGEGVPVANQRLIFSGRVLKDEDPLDKGGLKSGCTVHLVKGAKPAPPPSAAASVPSSFAAGNQIAGNPLAPLLNAQNAGALAGFNPFAGHNTNNPDLMRSMMNDPAAQAQMGSMLSDPAVVEQLIQMSPELRAMGPQVRQMMQSEQFRSFLTNPEAMASMRQMMASGGMPGMPGMGGAPAPTQQGAGGALFNPWANNPAPAAPAGAIGGGMPDFASMMQQMGGMGAMGGGFGAPAVPAGPVVPPEERFQTELAQLAAMGFNDASKNVRALLASGGNVEAAVEYIFSMP